MVRTKLNQPIHNCEKRNLLLDLQWTRRDFYKQGCSLLIVYIGIRLLPRNCFVSEQIEDWIFSGFFYFDERVLFVLSPDSGHER